MKTVTLGTKGFHVGEYLADEMQERGLSRDQLAEDMRFPGDSIGVMRLVVDFVLDYPIVEMYLGDDEAERLSQAFGISKECLMRLDAAWHVANGAPAERPSVEH